MTGYVRVDTGNNIADGNVISAADLDNEFDGVQAAFNASTGHTHDGTSGEGAPITKIGPTQDVTASSSLLAPKTTNTVDVGSSSLKFKDLYLAGNASIGGTLAVTGVATFTAQPVLSSLTASKAVFSDGSKGLVSNDITGTGNVVMSNSPTLVTPALGTPSSVTLTNATGLPIATGVSGLGTGVATALAVNIGSAGAAVVNGGALGTPSSGTLTNATGLPIASGVSGLGTGIATALAVNTGSAGAPVLFNGALGTPSSGTVTNLTGTASININGTVGATTPATGAFTTLEASGTTTLSGNQIISVTDNTNAALRVTQLGTGNALLVEDSSNPDSTPFVIDASGRVLKGFTETFTGLPSVSSELQVLGTVGWSTLGRYGANTTSPIHNLVKSRSTTIGSWGVVSSGDGLGGLRMYGDDGTQFVEGARIEAAVDGTPGTNDMPGRLVFSTTADGASSPTERMRIDSAGRVGMGTTSLSALLTVNSETDTTAYNGSATDGQLTAGATQLIRAGAGANTNVAQLVFQSRASQPFNRIVSSGGTAPFMAFATNNAERMRIDSSGNLGIGTSSPTAKLEVYDATTAVARVTAGTEIFEIRNTGSEVRLAVVSADPMTFRTSNVEAMRIDSNGNVGIGNTAANVNDQVGAVRPLLVSKSDTSTTIAGSQAAIVIGNADTTTSNTSQISFAALTGANTTYFASAAINCVFGARTNGQYPTGQLVFSTSTSLNSAPTEKMRIDSSGNVGIGTSSPGVRLDVATSSGSSYSRFTNGTVTVYNGVSSSNIGAFGTSSNHDVQFIANDTERARITSAGLFQFNSGYGSVATAYGCRAWVNFNGQGTVAIRGSGNVSSITDNGSGLYTVNLTTAMPDTNYAMTGFLRRDNDSSSSAAYLTANATQTKSTSAVAVRTGYIDNGGGVGTADMPEIDIAIFR